MVQLLPSNRSWLCGVQKTRADKKELTRSYPKSVDHKITPKGTLSYPMRYMAKILPGVTTDIASHKK